MTSTQHRFTLFGKTFRIEIAEAGFYLGASYTNNSYHNEHQIYIALLKRVWISWWDSNKKSRTYGIEINRSYMEIHYGLYDEFASSKVKQSRIIFFWHSITDFFFGKDIRLWGSEKYHGTFSLKMDYGDEYKVKVISKQLYTWRSRWIGKKRWLSYECTPDRGMPYQWKGENSWDCGDDATFSMSCAANSPEEALEKLKESCEKSRKKYWMVKNPKMVPDVKESNKGTLLSN